MTPVATAPLRLNLGCRKTRVPGFLNFDIRPEQDVDVVGDASDLKRYADGSVEEILASNILEHWPHVQTIEVLREWSRVLRPGGKLYLSVPDFESIVRLWNTTGRLDDWMIYHLYGEQGYDQQYHYIIFTWPNMRELLANAGFSSAQRVKSLPFGLADASSLLDNVTKQPVALNCIATK